MSTVRGVLKKITAKSGVGAKGPWTLYNLGISIDGSDDYHWFKYGFSKPDVIEGTYVVFDVVESPGYPGQFQVQGTINVDKEKTADAAAGAAAPAAGGSKFSGRGKPDDVQDSIVRQSSEAHAIAALDSMMANGVVSVPKAKAKAYEFYTTLLEELTTKFFVANRKAKTLDQIAADAVAPEEGAVDEGPTDEEIAAAVETPVVEKADDEWRPV
jgi:hypothetical protein